MHYEIKKAILDKIRQYPRIFLFRHIRGDGDCVGATKGLKSLITATWPEKQVLLIDDITADSLKFMGPDDAPVADELYRDSLGIVLDTATAERISNEKYALCKELIKIDHHIVVDNYGCLNWVEENRSSCCEMIVDLYETFRDQLVLTQECATQLYIGIVSDSGRFRYEGVSGDTLRRAATLLDVGIDTGRMFAQLYLEPYDYLKFKAYLYEKMGLTPNGVAYIVIDKAMQEKFSLTQEQASASVDTMESIRDCICWMVIIENDDGQTYRVRLRSRFVHINTLARKYRGGGHGCACGATLHSKDEIPALLADADALVKQYKEANDGWL